jgi:cysteine synthase
LVRLRGDVQRSASDVFIKLEYYNPTGSCEDGMALAMAQETGPTTNMLEEAPFGNKLIEA